MEKEVNYLSVIVFLTFVAVVFVLSARADVGTSLTIGSLNIPPALVEAVPNQTWAMNTNHTNAFDLDDYFIDNGTLTYTSSSVADINVTIDSSTNEVSFYPDIDFEGVRSVTFTARDPLGATTDSNLVTLNVTNDTRPPSWSSLGKNKVDSDIFQNTVVAFTASWEDDVDLGSFIFSIKQQSGWVNQSPVLFSGLQNTSSYSIQMSAPGGTLVSWQFLGFDSSGNMNATDVGNFTVSSFSAPPSTTGTTGSGTTDDDDEETTTTTPQATQSNSDFVVDAPDSFNIDIKQGETGSVTIKVTNTGDTGLSFDVEIDGLSEFERLLSDSNFTLASGETKTVTIEFSADARLRPDLYYGTFRVRSSAGLREIPIVIVVKATEIDLGLTLRIPEEFKEVRPGDLVLANITLENFADVLEQNITFYYALTDFSGGILDSGSEEFVFNARAVLLERELTVPETIERGDYIFFARAVSGQKIAIDSDVFEVGERFSVGAFVRSNILILLILLSGVVVSLLMIRARQTRERMRLLNLYLMVTELNKLMKKGKMDEAIDIYVRIKSVYGEPVSRTALENRAELKSEMEKLTKELHVKVLEKVDGKTVEKAVEKGGKVAEKEAVPHSSGVDSKEKSIEKEGNSGGEVGDDKKISEEKGEKVKGEKKDEKFEEVEKTGKREDVKNEAKKKVVKKEVEKKPEKVVTKKTMKKKVAKKVKK